MNRIAGRAGVVILLCILLLAGFVFFLCEYVARAGDWVIFSGSPHVYAGGNLDCGVVIDTNGDLLLDMQGGRTYASDELVKKSIVHWLGDRNGSISAPMLPSYASQIIGYDLLNGIYNYNGDSGKVQLSLDSQVQAAALKAMGDYKGTVAVYNYKTGQLICAVSTPTYDPDNVPDIEADTTGKYEGLYVNRFTQSAYIPGSIFKIVTLAAAFETIPDIENRKFVCTGSCEIAGIKVNCDDVHWDQTLKTAFRNSCNCAFAEIALELGGETLEEYALQFGVVDSITFDGITTAKGNISAKDADDVNVAWSAIGQHHDQTNPCAFLTFVGAIANDGRGVLPHMVETITVGGTTTYSASPQKLDRIMTSTTAKKLVEYMGFNVQDKYGANNFGGLTACAKTGTAEVGGDKKPNAMLAGFTTDEEYPFAFIVCVEDAGYGKTVCVPIISSILSACKASYDS